MRSTLFMPLIMQLMHFIYLCVMYKLYKKRKATLKYKIKMSHVQSLI